MALSKGGNVMSLSTDTQKFIIYVKNHGYDAWLKENGFGQFKDDGYWSIEEYARFAILQEYINDIIKNYEYDGFFSAVLDSYGLQKILNPYDYKNFKVEEQRDVFIRNATNALVSFIRAELQVREEKDGEWRLVNGFTEDVISAVPFIGFTEDVISAALESVKL